ncbi:hypothetical protein [Streptomyces sp. NPDC093568]|uniref:hypothetical protein n=1 Tax=Streptomyces sp. NPDC093568 TaxID=3366041 RepID=UPI0038247729
MNPIRLGRTVLFLLPYILVVSGVLAASKVAAAPGGTGVAFEALGVTAIGALWAWRRGRRNGY